MLENTAAGRSVHNGLTLMLCSGVDTVYIRVEIGGENERNQDPTNPLKGTLTKTTPKKISNHYDRPTKVSTTLHSVTR